MGSTFLVEGIRSEDQGRSTWSAPLAPNATNPRFHCFVIVHISPENERRQLPRGLNPRDIERGLDQVHDRDALDIYKRYPTSLVD